MTEGLQQLHHRLEHSNNEMVRRLEQVGSVRRAQRSLRTVSQQAAAALDSLGKVWSLSARVPRVIPSLWRLHGSGAELAPRAAGQQGSPSLHPIPHHDNAPLSALHPGSGGRPPERGVSPARRHEERAPAHVLSLPSQHLHKKGSITLSRAWPLGSLMKAYDGVGTPLVVDVGASIGYFRCGCARACWVVGVVWLGACTCVHQLAAAERRGRPRSLAASVRLRSPAPQPLRRAAQGARDRVRGARRRGGAGGDERGAERAAGAGHRPPGARPLQSLRFWELWHRR